MKVNNIFKEGSVVNFGKAQHKQEMRNRFNDKQEQRSSHAQQQSEMFSQIDHAVAATVDFLINEKDMDQTTAEQAVYSHLSDLAMMHDLA